MSSSDVRRRAGRNDVDTTVAATQKSRKFHRTDVLKQDLIEVPGIGRSTEQTLQRHGIKTTKDLLQMRQTLGSTTFQQTLIDKYQVSEESALIIYQELEPEVVRQKRRKLFTFMGLVGLIFSCVLGYWALGSPFVTDTLIQYGEDALLQHQCDTAQRYIQAANYTSGYLETDSVTFRKAYIAWLNYKAHVCRGTAYPSLAVFPDLVHDCATKFNMEDTILLNRPMIQDVIRIVQDMPSMRSKEWAQKFGVSDLNLPRAHAQHNIDEETFKLLRRMHSEVAEQHEGTDPNLLEKNDGSSNSASVQPTVPICDQLTQILVLAGRHAASIYAELE